MDAFVLTNKESWIRNLLWSNIRSCLLTLNTINGIFFVLLLLKKFYAHVNVIRVAFRFTSLLLIYQELLLPFLKSAQVEFLVYLKLL